MNFCPLVWLLLTGINLQGAAVSGHRLAKEFRGFALLAPEALFFEGGSKDGLGHGPALRHLLPGENLQRVAASGHGLAKEFRAFGALSAESLFFQRST